MWVAAVVVDVEGGGEWDDGRRRWGRRVHDVFESEWRSILDGLHRKL